MNLRGPITILSLVLFAALWLLVPEFEPGPVPPIFASGPLKVSAGSLYLVEHLRETALFCGGLRCFVLAALGFLLDALRVPVVPRQEGA